MTTRSPTEQEDEHLHRFAASLEASGVDAAPSEVPARIGKYEIIREIGRGGMAVVYEGFDTDLCRPVAIKLLKAPDDPRLAQEAALSARLRHPHIVTIFESGAGFIAMELVGSGATLASTGPGLSREDRLSGLEQVAEAVAFAHAHGVVHLDLKPANVLVDEQGRLMLTDFGLARKRNVDDALNAPAGAGTLQVMSPEQIRNEDALLGPATDVWALGVMLYEIMTGTLPFARPHGDAVRAAILREQPARVRGPAGAIVARALDKNPARRYADAGAFLEDLRRLRSGAPLPWLPVGRLALGLRWARRLWRPWIVAGATATIGAVLPIVWMAREREDRRLDETMREQAQLSLQGALALGRAGDRKGMMAYLGPLETAAQRAVRRRPELPEANYLRGKMYRILLDEGAAQRFQSRALRRDPGYAPALYERAVLLFLAGMRARSSMGDLTSPADAVDTTEAARTGRAFLDAMKAWSAGGSETRRSFVWPGPGAADLVRGLLAFHEGDGGRARRAIEAALKADPLLDEGWEALTLVLFDDLTRHADPADPRWDEVDEVLTRNVIRAPGYLLHRIARAELRRQRAELLAEVQPEADWLAAFARAEQDFGAVVEADPGNPDAWCRRGTVRLSRLRRLLEVGRDGRATCREALADFDKAVTLASGFARARLGRGSARLFCGQAFADDLDGVATRGFLEGAEQDLSLASRRHPTFGPVYKWRGRTRALLATLAAREGGPGRDAKTLEDAFNSAEQDLSRALATMPADHETWLFRSDLWRYWAMDLSERGLDPNRALDQAQRSLDRAAEQAVRSRAGVIEAARRRLADATRRAGSPSRSPQAR
jgi:tetratricopeptide (TPR) repeat protein